MEKKDEKKKFFFKEQCSSDSLSMDSTTGKWYSVVVSHY